MGACPGPSHRLPQACAIQEHKPRYPRKGWSRSQPQKPETHEGAKHPRTLKALEEVKWQPPGSRSTCPQAPKCPADQTPVTANTLGQQMGLSHTSLGPLDQACPWALELMSLHELFRRELSSLNLLRLVDRALLVFEASSFGSSSLPSEGLQNCRGRGCPVGGSNFSPQRTSAVV